jgi:SRSO17 transposase
LIDRRLYLPEHSWCSDPERRHRAGIPKDIQFATKPQRAGEMIAAALEAGITASWVTGDEAYGQDPRLRAALEARGIGYVMAFACSMRVKINHGRTAVRADIVAGRMPATAWQRHSAGNGAKGPRYYDWAWIHLCTGSHRQLLIRRNRSTGELAFYPCWSPTAAPLSDLVRFAGIRWSVEECFQAAKGQVGLDHYQVRNWTSWHRHITLAMLALAFLAALATDAAPQRPTDPHHPVRSNGPIALTVPEIRRRRRSHSRDRSSGVLYRFPRHLGKQPVLRIHHHALDRCHGQRSRLPCPDISVQVAATGVAGSVLRVLQR